MDELTNQIPQTEAPEESNINMPVATPEDGSTNVINPSGDLVSIPSSQMDDALSNGYRAPSEEEVSHFEKVQKYGTLPQQALTAGEGLAQGFLGPLAPAAEKALGVKDEDILSREEVNPISHYGSEIAGLAGGMFTGVGEGALAEKLGVSAAKALDLGIAGSSTVSKIGSAAAKSAIENSLIAAGDEASHKILNDPSQTAESALISVGLGGLIGGGLGTVSPIWKATMGPKLGAMLDSIKNRTGGIEGLTDDAVHNAIQATGIDIAPEIKSALSDDPNLRTMFQTLQESSTKSGEEAQESLKQFKNQVSKSILDSFGKSEDDIVAGIRKSDYDVGTDIKKSISKTIKDQIDPISEKFNSIKKKYQSEELPQLSKDKIANDIAELTDREGYSLSPSSPQAKIINSTMEEIQGLKTLEDVRKYQSIIGDNTFSNPDLRRLGGQLKGILRNAEDDTIQMAAGRIDPKSVGEHTAARLAYKESMGVIDALNDRLHVGKFNGPDSFISALKEMSPEDVVRRLNPKGDAGLIPDLLNHFPEVADHVRNYHVDQVLKQAMDRAAPHELINSKAFFTALDKMSPEMKNFAVPMESGKKLSALKSLIDGLPARLNTSGTAKALDSLWNKVPASALGMISALAGHGPIAGYLLGKIGQLLSRDIPDAGRLAMLKFLGSSRPIEAEGFKSMADYLHSVIKGENQAARAVKNVFRADTEVLPDAAKPSEEDRSKLIKILKALKTAPQDLLKVGDKIGAYLPDHSMALGQVAGNSVAYLNSIEPNTEKQYPLDKRRPASAPQKDNYRKALDIAIQPLVVLDKIKKGNLTPQDTKALSTMYPGMHKNLSQKLVNEMIDIDSKGKSVPYKTRISMSLFLGEPLDSSLTPQCIMSAQPQDNSQQQTQPAVGEPKPKAKHSMNALNKLPGAYQTKDQAREARSNK
jgi:hypothetical protein